METKTWLEMHRDEEWKQEHALARGNDERLQRNFGSGYTITLASHT
jgi:hypothetical protein